tara:strand:+ start:50 stop:922 length:873 start_codon:yes stop_codon:yes gene_type:complete
MTKIDKSQYSKEEWRALKEQRRQEKLNSSVAVSPQPLVDVPLDVSNNRWAKGFGPGEKRYVVCLKYGTKYSAEYVNVLYNMVKRNLTIPFEFVCFTEDHKNINREIRIEPLPVRSDVSGWWYKPYFFNPELPLKGTILFIDLDVVIFNNIDYLFTYLPGQFCIIRDFNKITNPTWKKFNSSIFRLETGQHPQVYTNFISNPKEVSKRFHGDQDWIFNQVTSNFNYFPDEWLQSYKWEMRGKPHMQRDKNGVRNFLTPGEPKILSNTSVAIFHGEPNPHNCIDQWVVDNWR